MASELKVGDRVRVIGEELHPDRAEYAGLTGKVIAVHAGGSWDYTVDLGEDWDWDWFSASEVELAEAVDAR